MKIGILESPQDGFIQDVVSRLQDHEVEFLSYGETGAPVAGEYRVVVDRLSFQHTYLTEIMKSLALGGTYVINNPFAASATNKVIDHKLGSLLGIPFPRTVLLPCGGGEGTGGVIREPSWERVVQEVGLPCILKPYNGYAWDDVYLVSTLAELRELYQSLAAWQVLLAQQLIKYRYYYRAFCLDQKEVLFIRWVPRPQALGQYLASDLQELEPLKDTLAEMTIQLNQSLDLDVNVVEWCLDEEGRPWAIDAFNEVPEINKENLPEQYYLWIVDKFVDCIRDKVRSGRRNRTLFQPASSLARASS